MSEFLERRLRSVLEDVDTLVKSARKREPVSLTQRRLYATFRRGCWAHTSTVKVACARRCMGAWMFPRVQSRDHGLDMKMVGAREMGYHCPMWTPGQEGRLMRRTSVSVASGGRLASLCLVSWRPFAARW